jgi:hypothetical protein
MLSPQIIIVLSTVVQVMSSLGPKIISLLDPRVKYAASVAILEKLMATYRYL